MSASAKGKVRRRRHDDDDDDLDDLPPPPGASEDRMPWEKTDRFAKEVEEILASVEAPPVDAQVHRTLQKHLYRSGIFGTDGRGHITLLIRTILESENNQDALIEPVVSAVSSCMRPEWTGLGVRWIECFDSIPLKSMLNTLRDLFGEHDLSEYYCVALRRKIAAILEPVQAAPQEEKKGKPQPKPPPLVTRVPAIVKNIELGTALLALRDATPCNKKFGRDVRKRFPGVDQVTASEAMKVARVYGTRPEIYRRLSWIALFELSSPKMSQSVRAALEAKVMAGESVTGPQIRKARGRLKGGCLKRKPDQPAGRNVVPIRVVDGSFAASLSQPSSYGRRARA